MLKQNDRDMLFIIMVMHTRMTEWLNTDCGLEIHDKNKIKAITQLIMDLFVQYAKREGTTAFKELCESSKNFSIAVLAKDEKVTETIHSFDACLVKNSIKNIIENSCKCSDCIKCDWKNCDWLNLQKFIESKTTNHKKGECPYKLYTEDLFNFDDISI